ncbi:hypothetical protein KIN20_016863 [Parelaphostrongylus tenuis]|uniref:Uncharacterized protein n=1 Tax=Parelaphostrongylus tenuis TaxID=148309 RepID=A0AAD5QQ68_PARTN|nr:hypothetical protein KIN20_016863 [Parelaphostrongylus tenuis]
MDARKKLLRALDVTAASRLTKWITYIFKATAKKNHMKSSVILLVSIHYKAYENELATLLPLSLAPPRLIRRLRRHRHYGRLMLVDDTLGMFRWRVNETCFEIMLCIFSKVYLMSILGLEYPGLKSSMCRSNDGMKYHDMHQLMLKMHDNFYMEFVPVAGYPKLGS